jgi:putative hydrolase of HD superfamily
MGHSPLEVVQAQLDAYNARDIDAFAKTFADGAEGLDLETGAARFKGQSALKARYGASFRDHSSRRSAVVNRGVLGEYVFELEPISGMSRGADGRVPAPFFLMAICRVRGGKIDRCWFSPRASAAG